MIAAAAALVLAASTACAKADPAQLVALHETARQAHLKGDATLMAPSMSDKIVMAEDGDVQVRSKTDVVSFFTGYFKRIRYSAWQDTSEPKVTISPDGQLAWMAVGVAARYSRLDKPEEGEKSFKSSWIATYERANCAWRMTGMASDVVN